VPPAALFVFHQAVRYLYEAAEGQPRMRAVVQRVTEAQVTVGETSVARIGVGLCVLLGIASGDTSADADSLCDKIVALRLFDDDTGKMNWPLRAVDGSLLIVSQFTLYGDCRKGNRPSFTDAARPEHAMLLYEHFVTRARAAAVPVVTGQFQARMRVELVNDGPVTILLDTAERGR
jgi:D-tyrosyl-tRNA(Tyr) deacylase